METSDKLFELIRNILQQLPSLLTILVCMVLAVSRWKKHPRVSLVLVIGLVLLMGHTLFFAVAYNWVPGWLRETDWLTIQTLLTALGFIYNTALAVPLALLLIAIFMQRKPVPKPAQDDRPVSEGS